MELLQNTSLPTEGGYAFALTEPSLEAQTKKASPLSELKSDACG